MSTSLNQLSVSDLRKAANIKERIEALEKELNHLIGTASQVGSAPAASVPRKKGGMSAAGKARIVAAQKARWAKVKAAKAAGSPVAPRKKGGMSPEGKARIVAAQKARWAKVKAAKATAKPVAPAPKKKFTMSAAAKAKISAAAKARWAKAKAAKK
jgi:hypothetical protein